MTASRLAEILEKYKDVFSDELGTMKDTNAHIELKADAVPRFYKPRQVPYALRPLIDAELDRLVNQGVLRPVEHSEWAAPIVPVPKAGGDLRICGDYKLTANREAKCNVYPLPKTEDIFASLAGSEKFTKLDLAHAYQQILLDDETRKLLTINTHKGLFEPTRLTYGIHAASGIFQHAMEKKVEDIPWTKARSDDVLISGRNDDDHLKYIEKTLSRFQQ